MKAPPSAASARRTPGKAERQKYSGHRRQLHHRPAAFVADAARTRRQRHAAALRHAQRRISQARRRPHRLSEIFAGIFRAVRQEAAELGARIIGGCCGTTPEHIHAMAEAVKKIRPAKPGAAQTGRGGAIEVLEPAERFRRVAAREPESRLWKKIQAEKFVVSVEIDPPKGVTVDRIVEQVGRVMASRPRRRHRHQ